MSFLAKMFPRKSDAVDAARDLVREKQEEMTAAVERLERAIDRNIQQTVQRTMAENARLTNRGLRPRHD